MMLVTLTWLLQAAIAGGAGGQVDADNRLRRDASDAQARFERVRRANLPREFGGGCSSTCDARIGRFCYWYDSTQRNAVPEPPRITSARNHLLATLDSAARRSPSDGWIAGQRVRYLIEAGRTQDAIDATAACEAERWWCSALQGLALHVAEHYVVADSAFARALREMPEGQRCEWLDLRLVAPDRLERQLSRGDCAERAQLAADLWRVSQPLWSVSLGGNDLRTEHFARLTMAKIFERSENGHGIAWSGDSRELLVRYGWAEWFTRGETLPHSMDGPRVTGHDREPSYYFFPDVTFSSGFPRLTSESWNLRNPLARTRYAPRHVERLTELPHQLTRFARGDSMQIVAVFQSRDTAITKDSTNARIVSLVGDRFLSGGASPDGRTASLTLPRNPAVVSIEVRGARSKHAARARYMVEPLPCSDMCLADMLLFRSVGAADSTLERALQHALGEMRHASRDPLGIYWELQRPNGTATPAWFSLTVTPARVGRLRRLATQLHLAPGISPVRLRWQSVIEGTRASGAVSVGLPPTARGQHRVVLTIEPAGSPPVRTEREVVLTP